MVADLPPTLAGIGDEAGSELGVQLDALAHLGWNTIELRTIDRKAVCELSAAELDVLATRLRERDMTVCCLSSNIGGWGRSTATPLTCDLEELERLKPVAEALGCSRVRVMSWQNADLHPRAWREDALTRMRALTDRAERLGLVLLHENCSGWGGQSSAASLELVEAVASPNLRLLLDIGNCVAYGQDAVAFTNAILGSVEHVHVKDAVRRGGTAHFVTPGLGEARVADCLRLLRNGGYTGVLSVEPHLHAQPHLGRKASGDRALLDFLACARALATLVHGIWELPTGPI
jgi:L-ribulose-5-phosphate 3-epimerase